MRGSPPASRRQRPRPDTIVTGGLLVTAAPAVGYLVAWVHELGYDQAFQVPTTLIAPQLGSVLAATVVLVLSLMVIFALVELYQSFRGPGPPGPIESRVLVIVGAAVLIGLVLDGNWSGHWDLKATLIWAAFVLAIGLVAFASGIRHPRSFRERLRLADRRVARPSVVVTAVVGQIGEVASFLIAGVFLVGFAAYALGGFQAQTQTDFLVSGTSPPEVVLAIDGDTVVLAPFDQSKHVIRPEFDVLKIGAQALHLRWMKVGPFDTQPGLPR